MHMQCVYVQMHREAASAALFARSRARAVAAEEAREAREARGAREAAQLHGNRRLTSPGSLGPSPGTTPDPHRARAVSVASSRQGSQGPSQGSHGPPASTLSAPSPASAAAAAGGAAAAAAAASVDERSLGLMAFADGEELAKLRQQVALLAEMGFEPTLCQKAVGMFGEDMGAAVAWLTDDQVCYLVITPDAALILTHRHGSPMTRRCKA